MTKIVEKSYFTILKATAKRIRIRIINLSTGLMTIVVGQLRIATTMTSKWWVRQLLHARKIKSKLPIVLYQKR